MSNSIPSCLLVLTGFFSASPKTTHRGIKTKKNGKLKNNSSSSKGNKGLHLGKSILHNIRTSKVSKIKNYRRGSSGKSMISFNQKKQTIDLQFFWPDLLTLIPVAVRDTNLVAALPSRNVVIFMSLLAGCQVTNWSLLMRIIG